MGRKIVNTLETSGKEGQNKGRTNRLQDLYFISSIELRKIKSALQHFREKADRFYNQVSKVLNYINSDCILGTFAANFDEEKQPTEYQPFNINSRR